MAEPLLSCDPSPSARICAAIAGVCIGAAPKGGRREAAVCRSVSDARVSAHHANGRARLAAQPVAVRCRARGVVRDGRVGADRSVRGRRSVVTRSPVIAAVGRDL